MAFVLQFYCSYGVNKSDCRGLKGRNRLKSSLIRLYSRLFFIVHGCSREAMVRITGLEPARFSAQDPKSCVSANFTISANFRYYTKYFFQYQ